MSFGSDFILTMITNDPALARRGDEAGIDCIGLDFEKIGKRERQSDPKAWISDHEESQIPAVREALRSAKLFARTNALYSGSRDEVDRLIAAGAQVLMLPMFTTAEEVARFVDFVAGRAEISLLLETPQAVVRIHDIARVGGIDEINLGLNDLHRALGLKSHFEVLTSGLLDMVSDEVRGAGVRFGFGTVGRAGDTGLPIPPDLIYAQYPRLNATSARVFRFFLGPDPMSLDLPYEVSQLRKRLDHWHGRGPEAREEAREALREKFRNWP